MPKIAHPDAGRYDNIHGDEHLLSPAEEERFEEAQERLESELVRDCLMGAYGFDWLWANDQHIQLAKDVQKAVVECYDGTLMDSTHLGFEVEEAYKREARIFAAWIVEAVREGAEGMEYLADNDESRRKRVKGMLK